MKWWLNQWYIKQTKHLIQLLKLNKEKDEFRLCCFCFKFKFKYIKACHWEVYKSSFVVVVVVVVKLVWERSKTV
jgi:hypothetical protein